VGGSDRHVKPFRGEPAPDDLGTPTTWVYARELSTAGILEGIRAGHVFISASPQGPQLFLSAAVDSDHTGQNMMGDEIVVSRRARRALLRSGSERQWADAVHRLGHRRQGCRRRERRLQPLVGDQARR